MVSILPFIIVIATFTLGIIISIIIAFMGMSEIKKEEIFSEIFTRIIFALYGFMNIYSLVHFLELYYK